MTRRMLAVKAEKLFVHCVLKAVGRNYSGDPWIWAQTNKETLLRELLRYLKLYQGLKLNAFSILDGHCHLVISIDNEKQSNAKELVAAYLKIYGKVLDRRTHKFHKLLNEQSDLSSFMQRFCREFALHYNWEHKNVKRDGHMWGKPFHATLIFNSDALLRVFVYNMFNPVKAGLVSHPKDYPLNSMNYQDVHVRNQILGDLFESFRYLSDNESLSIDAFEELLQERIIEEEERLDRLREQKVREAKGVKLSRRKIKKVSQQVMLEERSKQHFLSRSKAIGDRSRIEKYVKEVGFIKRISVVPDSDLSRC